MINKFKKIINVVLFMVLLSINIKINALSMHIDELKYGNSNEKIKLVGDEYMQGPKPKYDMFSFNPSPIKESSANGTVINYNKLKNNNFILKMNIDFDYDEIYFEDDKNYLIEILIYDTYEYDFGSKYAGEIVHIKYYTKDEIKNLDTIDLDFSKIKSGIDFTIEINIINEEDLTNYYNGNKDDIDYINIIPTMTCMPEDYDSFTDCTQNIYYLGEEFEYTVYSRVNDQFIFENEHGHYDIKPLKGYFDVYDNFKYSFALNKVNKNKKYNLEYYFCNKKNICKLQDIKKDVKVNKEYFNDEITKSDINSMGDEGYIKVEIYSDNILIRTHYTRFFLNEYAPTQYIEFKVIDEANHNVLENNIRHSDNVKLVLDGFNINEDDFYYLKITENDEKNDDIFDAVEVTNGYIKISGKEISDAYEYPIELKDRKVYNISLFNQCVYDEIENDKLYKKERLLHYDYIKATKYQKLVVDDVTPAETKEIEDTLNKPKPIDKKIKLNINNKMIILFVGGILIILIIILITKTKRHRNESEK